MEDLTSVTAALEDSDMNDITQEWPSQLARDQQCLAPDEVILAASALSKEQTQERDVRGRSKPGGRPACRSQSWVLYTMLPRMALRAEEDAWSS